MARIAVCFLLDARGRVLLQHRDAQAPRSANLWGMVGGHVEEGEGFDAAMLRELEEETGIVAGLDQLVLWQDTDFRYSDGHGGHYRIYSGRFDLTDDDIVVGEGQAITFLEPDRALGLPMAESCAHFLPMFLDSDLYRDLTTR